VRAILASPLGFLIGLSLAALGGGGSILAVPALVYAAGQDPREATASSLVLVGGAALIGMAGHWRAGRVRVGTGLVLGLSGIVGSVAGSALNRRLDPDALLLGFSALALLAAWRMLVGCPTCTTVGERQAVEEVSGASSRGGVGLAARVDVTRAAQVLVAGTAVGFLTGLFGVGGGFVIVPVLTLALGLSMPQAIGTSLLVIALNSAVALATRLATTSIDWAVTVPFAVAALAGVLSGGRIADRIDARRSLRWFAGLLIVVAAYTAVNAAAGLR
jgi:uncharacterized membrane protein YfcA